MLVHIILTAFILLALLGDARIFLFILNRFVFGAHRQEKSPWTWLIFTVPPVLVVMTALWLPLNRWIELLMSTRFVERMTPARIEELTWSVALAKIGAAWLIIAALVAL